MIHFSDVALFFFLLYTILQYSLLLIFFLFNHVSKVFVCKEGRNFMDKKAITVGIENFERIIKDGYYYVDKSLLIEEMLENQTLVTFFIRPRRFGKTLICQ